MVMEIALVAASHPFLWVLHVATALRSPQSPLPGRIQRWGGGGVGCGWGGVSLYPGGSDVPVKPSPHYSRHNVRDLVTCGGNVVVVVGGGGV